MDAPARITVRLGEDFNWWVESAADATSHRRGILDPRQVAHLVETLDEYRDYGYRPERFAEAFQCYRVDAELSEGVLRLAATDQMEGAFALPRLGEDDDGPYFDFLDLISAARIRRLNQTHHYVRDCTEEEMFEELDLRDADRYFSAQTIHVFDELNEILEWSPAEWDQP